jgi:hypothetical protein
VEPVFEGEEEWGGFGVGAEADEGFGGCEGGEVGAEAEPVAGDEAVEGGALGGVELVARGLVEKGADAIGEGGWGGGVREGVFGFFPAPEEDGDEAEEPGGCEGDHGLAVAAELWEVAVLLWVWVEEAGGEGGGDFDGEGWEWGGGVEEVC